MNYSTFIKEKLVSLINEMDQYDARKAGIFQPVSVLLPCPLDAYPFMYYNIFCITL